MRGGWIVQNYESYVKDIKDDILTCLDSMGCQPILFIGSGLSRRYVGAPNWEELMKKMTSICPRLDKEFAYYKQSFGNLMKIGSVFAENFKEWAWSDGRKEYPDGLFSDSTSPEIYLKYKVCEYFDTLVKDALKNDSTKDFENEINALKSIRPHAVITTNYDRLIENIFDEYQPIIGQQILHANYLSVGEIFKIHGCVTEPESLILTENDYSNFLSKKKYLSAKLLAYFAEHPLLICGYSAEDPNIKSILSDIDEIISTENELIPNIYILEWKENIGENERPPKEKIISVDTYRSVRVKSITTSSFDWVFETFASNSVIEKVSPKLLRALLARTYDLVRCDIPRSSVEVDYQTLEHAVTKDGELAKIFGISSIHDPKAVNAAYPYTLSKVAELLGYSSWHYANQFVQQVKEEKGMNIKASDNKYHIAIKTGNSMYTHKYSEATVDLLKKIKDSVEYEVII